MNRYFLEFALNSIFVHRKRNIFITLLIAFVVFLVGSVMFVATSIEHEVTILTKSMPQIIVQKKVAGSIEPVEKQRIYKLLDIPGVESVIPRIWGLYRFDKADVSFALIGLDGIDYDYLPQLTQISKNVPTPFFSKMYVGSGVAKILQESYYKEYFNFILPDGTLKKIIIAGEFSTTTALLSNDVILLEPSDIRQILGLDDNMVTDFAVYVPNKDEVDTIANKIVQLYPDMNTITQEDLKATYMQMFNYKGGIFLTLFIIVIAVMFMIVTDRLTGIGSSEKKEIAILKAVGWSIQDVIRSKFYEAFFVASSGYFIGILIALVYVYIFQAPVIRDVFTGFSAIKPELDLNFYADFSLFALLFFFSVIPYMAAVIIPTWRVAVYDVDEVLR